MACCTYSVNSSAKKTWIEAELSYYFWKAVFPGLETTVAC